MRHPAIEMAQVFGIPDEARGEAVCAWIKLKPDCVLTAGDIKAFCLGQIANFKIPRQIFFVRYFHDSDWQGPKISHPEKHSC